MPSGFHTPIGVTSFRTHIARAARRGNWFLYAYRRDFVSDPDAGKVRQAVVTWFPYAYRRDFVSDSQAMALGRQGRYRFHTPIGVTSFRTHAHALGVSVAKQSLHGFHTPIGVTSFRTASPPYCCSYSQTFPYAYRRDFVSDNQGRVNSLSYGRFPYAYRRDFVSDVTARRLDAHHQPVSIRLSA